MAIDYTTDITPFYATEVVTDPNYSVIPAALRDQASEQQILTTIEVIRAHMAIFTTEEEARLFHYCIGRMLAAVAYSGYADKLVRATGNVSNPQVALTNGLTIVANGTTVTLADAPYADLAALITELNTGLSAANIEVLTLDGQHVTFQNAAGFEGESITLSGTGLNTIGLLAKDYHNAITQASIQAREDAIAMFTRQGRPVAADL